MGLVAHDILPIKVDGITYGWLAVTPLTPLYPDNVPTHVYFGILGDIKWMQVSDQNLHIQMNYIKERLGKPWEGEPEYYTPEKYNGPDNKYAIDINHFLGYLKTTRYNQIKGSVVDEALVSNNYFWLYKKFHREFGCDQKVKYQKKQITEKKNDQTVLSGV